MEYMTVSAQKKNIAIMRVENGWLVRTNEASNVVTPLLVAETPERLAQIVTDWAQSSAAT